MESNSFIERLIEYNLTRQEAAIYQCLLREGKTTGYEVAKILGISRSNAYNSLASMTEKGAAYLVEEGHTKKYVPVPLEEFCKNFIRRMEENKKWLLAHMPKQKYPVEGYITIEGASNVLNKVKNLLVKAEKEAYISCTRNYLLLLVEELEFLKRSKKKIVIVTDQPVTLGDAKVYIGEPRGMQIGLITDSKYVLAGEYGEGSVNTCLYSGQKYFVELYKRALSNEIQLLAIQEEKQKS